jgi:uncharacterized integral membrane protein (TIGR00698 family)
MQSRVARVLPGLAVCGVVAAIAMLITGRHAAPVMLFALLFGMAVNFLGAHAQCRAGVDFASRDVLRIGVALLGLRITLADFATLGWGPVVLVIGAVASTILASVALARALGFRASFGLLTGGATAICGASAALALAAALPAHPAKERATLFTVVVVSVLSTLAMIAYPLIARAANLPAQAAGVFLGATIHDVAQVVGAGYAMSPVTGDTATVVKLMRIAMLLPVIVCAAVLTRRSDAVQTGPRPPLLPLFAIGFVLLAALNSAGWIAEPMRLLGEETSRWCLAIAIGAIGMKTQLRQIAYVGLRPVLLMIVETLFLATLVLAWVRWGSGIGAS